MKKLRLIWVGYIYNYIQYTCRAFLLTQYTHLVGTSVCWPWPLEPEWTIGHLHLWVGGLLQRSHIGDYSIMKCDSMILYYLEYNVFSTLRNKGESI